MGCAESSYASYVGVSDSRERQSTHCLIARDCDDVLAANGFHFEHTCDTRSH